MRIQQSEDIVLLDVEGLYGRVVEHARVATGADLVIAASFDEATGRIRTRAVSGHGGGRAQRALRAVRRFYPGFDPMTVELDVHVNPVQEAVFLGGEAITVPFMKVAEHVVPELVLRIAAKLVGLRYSTVQPLIVQGRVIGSLSFHGGRVPKAADLRSYEAFAGQASLTLENAVLVEEMRAQHEELREARRLVSAGNEAVRRDIAETLHGSVQTQLLVADLNLQKALTLIERGPQQAKAIIQEERARIEEVREHDIREVSHLLHPSVIKLGLAPAIRSLADRFRSMMEIELDIDRRLDGVGGRSEVDVDPDIRLTVYRLVEEALSNAHKHGGASIARASIRLSGQGDLEITITDNGSGFDPDAVSSGLGLRMIAMQVDEAGGKWSVTACDEGVGVILSAVIPTTLPNASGPPLSLIRTPQLLGSR